MAKRTTSLAASYTGAYQSWHGMKTRCLRPSSRMYYRYGGRGITVCERWMQFENFLADMGERPAGMSLDRIDSNGNYEPSNCRWADDKTQNRNRSNVRIYEFNGEALTLPEWAERLNVDMERLRSRM